MKVIILVVLILAFIATSFTSETKDLVALKQKFDALVAKHGRNYKNEEEYQTRFAIFQENGVRIEQMRKNDPGATYDFNKFFDLSKEEFDAHYKGFKKAPVDTLARSCLASGITAPRLDVTDIPTAFDWRTKGVVNPVKDQAMCGSCWAFSTAANIESAHAIKNGKLFSLSEQQIVDCSHGCCNVPPYGKVCNQGCNGGWMWNAMQDIMATGIETEEVYPYKGYDEQCAFNKSKIVVTISNYTCLSNPNSTTGADEGQMATYTYLHGPLSIALNAEWLQFYYGGITDPWSCDATALDHAVLIVGYEVDTNWLDESVPVWIVRNSWGADWGESGYFRIARGSGVCGLNNAVVSAII